MRSPLAATEARSSADQSSPVNALPGGAARRDADFYPTPAFCVRRLLDSTSQLWGMEVLEPFAGNGAIARAFNAWHVEARLAPASWTLIELRAEARETLRSIGPTHIGDFFAVRKALEKRPHDLILSNPPYSIAAECVDACVTLARSWVKPAPTVMLLSLAFLATETRKPLFEKLGMPDVYVLPNRPSFTGAGSHTTDYAWMCWPEKKQPIGRTRVLALTPLAERKSA